jgi:hypothetical protein
MNSLVGFVLLVAVAGMVAWVAFASAGVLARRSRSTRHLVLVANAVVGLLGLVVGLWLPTQIPETSGSPASLVATVLLWMVGGGLAFLGTAAFLGAFLARPKPPAGSDISQS